MTSSRYINLRQSHNRTEPHGTIRGITAHSAFILCSILGEIDRIQSREDLKLGNPRKYTGAGNLEAMVAARNYNNFLSGLIKRFNPGTQTVLDFGAGIGTYAEILRQDGLRVICVEADKELLQILNSKGFVAQQSLSTIKPSSLDYVFSLNVLEHIEDERPVLAEFWRVLKPGGVLLLYVPAFQLLFSSMDKKVGHHRRYKKTGLKNLLVSQGFMIKSMEYTDTAGFAATVVFKLVGNKKGELNNRTVAAFDRYAFPLNRLLDPLFSHFLGKNLYACATKNSRPS